MNREALIDRITSVLGTHHTLEYSSVCLCGKRLYSPSEGTLTSSGAMTLGRHRAESIIDALGLDLPEEVSIT